MLFIAESLRHHMLNVQKVELEFFFVAGLSLQRLQQQPEFVSLALIDCELYQARNKRGIIGPPFLKPVGCQILLRMGFMLFTASGNHRPYARVDSPQTERRSTKLERSLKQPKSFLSAEPALVVAVEQVQ
jgi:hypothetical protein